MNNLLLDHLKKFEGCKLTAYQDQGGVWTIGYGCTGYGIVRGVRWQQERADNELEKRANVVALDAVKYSPILKDQNESKRAAIASFIYNCGVDAYLKSGLKISVDAGHWQESAIQIKKWNHVHGVVNHGLENRREAEACMLTKDN